MLSSVLALLRWSEPRLMCWIRLRKRMNDGVRHLNQAIPVLVRCRKSINSRVGICVGIKNCLICYNFKIMRLRIMSSPAFALIL
ncbi:hypothetical protein D6T76_17505 [Enterobacter hormaechei]|nr:hypothetical protein D6T76_17505 [Enterobacter hormaechei]